MPAPRLAVVSTYPPRMCGIASYTADLRAALCAVRPDWEVDIVAVDWDGLSYGDEVVTVVEPVDRASYVRAAGVVADQGTPVVLIQHEYGREYGRSGDNYRHSENLIALAQAASARDLRYAVTLHTVPSRSTEAHRTLLGEMCADAALVTVFTERARRIVEDLDIVAPDRILVVPHGAPPELLSADPEPLRRDLAELDSHGPVLSTFGLLAAPKGLEVAIDAVARLIDRHPTLRYVIAGRTHPEIVRRYGEAYRSQLADQIQRLGLTEHVRFLDDYLSTQEIGALLRRTTIMVTPYRSVEQTSSGVLTFALACGRPVVSTAYQYAEEFLATGAGRLVPSSDPAALAATLDDLLTDTAALERCGAIARTIGGDLTWPAVATRLAEGLETSGLTCAPTPGTAG